MAIPAGRPLEVSVVLTDAFPIGHTWFPASYFDFLRDLAHLPWPRIPKTYVRFAVKAAAELKRQRTVLEIPKVVVG